MEGEGNRSCSTTSADEQEAPALDRMSSASEAIGESDPVKNMANDTAVTNTRHVNRTDRPCIGGELVDKCDGSPATQQDRK